MRAPAIKRHDAWAGTDLVLAGHGATRPANGAPPAVEHARRLAAGGLFASVRAGFLFGAPSLEAAVAAGTAPALVVVPFLMSDGVYARKAVPARAAASARRAVLRVAAPVGTHPGLAGIVRDRAADRCRGLGVPSDRAAVVLVGHGSPRDPASAQATRACAARLAALGGFAEVRPALLDEPPSLRDALVDLAAPLAVVIGFFADRGRHAEDDVRALLGLGAGEDTCRLSGGRRVVYAGPIGAASAITELILDRVAEVSEAEALRRSA